MTQDNTPIPVTTHFVVKAGSVEQSEQVFVDGVSGMMVGVGVSKIHFHRVVGQEKASGGELREVVQTLCIPTTALLEFCANALTGLANSAEVLSGALEAEREKILRLKGSATLSQILAVANVPPAAKKEPVKKRIRVAVTKKAARPPK